MSKMKDSQGSEKTPEPMDRRRFLRKSAKGAVPYLAGLAGAGKLVGETSEPEKAPPPGASDAAPAEVRKELDRHREKFAAENPDLSSIADILSRE